MLPPFKILNINSVTDAVKELARLGDDARLYGGGTELLILLRHNLVRTEYLLNIKPIVELGVNRRCRNPPAAGNGANHP
jgi:CO/xanthine dehydrogenase FAD-binding subunit